jgi:hypothetical protein
MRNRAVWTWALAFAVALSLPFTAEAADRVTVPAGSRLMVGLDDTLDTGENDAGDRFSGYLDASVTVDGTTIAARGTKVYGRVRQLKKAGRFGGKPEMVLELTDVRLEDELVPPVTDRLAFDGESAKTLQKAGGGAAGGVVAHAIAGAAIGAAAGTTWPSSREARR